MKKISIVLALMFLSGVILMAQDAAPKPVPGKDAKADKARDGNADHQRAGMFAEYLKNSDPAKYEELKKLKAEDPEEFKKQVAALEGQAKEKMQKEREEFRDLAEKYRTSRSDEDRAALKVKMEQQMKRKIEFQKQRIASMEKGLADAKAMLEDAEKNMQAKIDEQINDILAGKFPGQEKRDARKANRDAGTK